MFISESLLTPLAFFFFWYSVAAPFALYYYGHKRKTSWVPGLIFIGGIAGCIVLGLYIASMALEDGQILTLINWIIILFIAFVPLLFNIGGYWLGKYKRRQKIRNRGF